MKMLNTANPKGLTMAHDLKRNYPVRPAMRWTKADNGRTIPLNSAAWGRMRRQVLNEEPLCRHCAEQGLVVPATEVDHMRGAADCSRDALQALCKSCHSRKTMAELYGRPQRLGCDENGYPRDKAHHWNAAAEKSPEADSQTPTCSLHAQGRTSQDG